MKIKNEKTLDDKSAIWLTLEHLLKAVGNLAKRIRKLEEKK